MKKFFILIVFFFMSCSVMERIEYDDVYYRRDVVIHNTYYPFIWYNYYPYHSYWGGYYHKPSYFYRGSVYGHRDYNKRGVNGLHEYNKRGVNVPTYQNQKKPVVRPSKPVQNVPKTYSPPNRTTNKQEYVRPPVNRSPKPSTTTRSTNPR